MSTFIQAARLLVKKLFAVHGEGPIHGYPHAMEVMHHARNGNCVYPHTLSFHKTISILLAALLHDVDDEKMFPRNTQCENARAILEQIRFPCIELVIEMIGLVSFSKNGISDVYISRSRRSSSSQTILPARTAMFSDDIGLFYQSKKHQVGTQHRIPKWKLIPRLADRIVALGTRGIGRCIAFGGQHDRPIFIDSTPRFSNVHELRIYAIRAWLGQVPSSYSSIDYFIRGLIPRCFMFSGIAYFDQLTQEGSNPIIEVILRYGQQAIPPKRKSWK